jgi:two-component system CheB/CheR fusion protein
MVSLDLRIRRFTPPSQKLLNLQPSDIGRRLGEIRTNLELQDLETLVQNTIHSASPQEHEVREKSGAWYGLRIRPYKTWDNKITGAVISLQDIDTLKRTLESTREYADELLENSQGCILLLDDKLRVTAANRAFYRTFDVTAPETEGRSIYELGDGQWNVTGLRRVLEDIIPKNAQVSDYEVRHDFPKLGPRTMLLNARRVELQPGRPSILVGIEDVSQRSQQGVA